MDAAVPTSSGHARSGDIGIWLTGLCAAVALGALIALLGYLAMAALTPFWPRAVVELDVGLDSPSVLGEVIDANEDALTLRASERVRVGSAYVRIRKNEIRTESKPADAIVLTLADGRRLIGRGDGKALLAAATAPADVVDTDRPNAAAPTSRFASAWRAVARFATAPPSAAALDGGVWPALVGTVTLVLFMSVLVMPFGVLAAVYLHEFAGRSWRARFVRGAVTNLAGVPSIVYGVLGLGLFVHGVGARVDGALFADRLPAPTFGAGGLLWAALTLALLTLPVVVVSVEEGLARIPPSLRLGSLALGATRGETLWRLLLPIARPALLTGMILAIARAAGAVAPLMLVGVVKLAPALPIDRAFPYLHPSRQFMHLGFAIYDSALASADSVRGVPRAYACAALLVATVIALNLAAMTVRNRLRERYRALAV